MTLEGLSYAKILLFKINSLTFTLRYWEKAWTWTKHTCIDWEAVFWRSQCGLGTRLYGVSSSQSGKQDMLDEGFEKGSCELGECLGGKKHPGNPFNSYDSIFKPS